MEFSQSFISAFKFTMIYEVGPFFNYDDPETQAGLCATVQQKKKTGYVNIAGDRGGETKFGIAKVFNPDVDIKKMTMFQAMEIYFKKYWLTTLCDKFSGPLALCVFDASVNHGSVASIKMLQRSINVEPDGQIGPITLGKLNSFPSVTLCDIILKSREDFFKAIVNRNSSQSKFLKGWLARVSSIRSFIQKNYK